MYAEHGMQEAAHQSDGQSQEHTQNTSLIEGKHHHQAAERTDQGFMADFSKHQFRPGASLVDGDGIGCQSAADQSDDAENDVIGNIHHLSQIITDLKAGRTGE